MLKRFLDSGYSTIVVLLVALGISCSPVWVPLVRRDAKQSPPYRIALYLTALEQGIQAWFIIGNGLNLVQLSESWHYAEVGVPLCLAGGGFALFSMVSDRRGAGCLLAAGFGAFLWLFLISVH